MDTRTTMRRLASLLLLAGLAIPAMAQDAPPSVVAPDPASASFLVSSVQIRFIRDNPANPAGYSLLDVPVRLTPVGADVFGPDDGSPGTISITLGEFASRGNVRLNEPALATLAPALLRRLKGLGLVGVYVTPDPAQFRVENGRVVDARVPDDSSLTLLVTLGQVTKLQTSANGDRIDPEEGDELVNNPLHDWIRRGSPVQPAGDGPPGSDLIQEDALADYTARLSRQPGRRVDVSVATPGETPGDVQLNYVITENRPWLLFAQVSNTGSASTSHWREHFGFIHNNLTNADDILTIDYQTANFSEVHSVAGSYERPFDDLSRFRWKLDGSWYSYRASDLGQQEVNFRGEGWDVGAHVAWNFFQERNLFLDLLAGVRYKNLRVDNQGSFTSGHNQFLLPDFALRLERHQEDSRTDALLTVLFNIPGAATDAETIDALGRTNADNDFTILKLDASHSFFLDPLFRDADAPAGGLVHELSFQVHAQESFGARLIPNEQDIAGGLYTVRGYPQAIVAGDDLIIGTAEYRFHLPQLLSPQPEPDELLGNPFRWHPQYALGPTDWDLVFKGFIDAGRVLNSSRLSFETNTTLVGAGVGVEWSLSRRIALRADFGIALKPIDDANGVSVVDNGHTELHFLATFVY